LAFLRFSRDKRGVENFYLVQPITNRRGKVRPQVLYWFRSPPDVKVGREPFDPGVRRALEAQNPGVEFDWRAIVETPIPSADADKWRERRRAERAAKHAAAEEEAAEAAEAADDEADVDAEPAASADAVAPVTASAITPIVAASPASGAPNGRDATRKRRRRRGGGGRSGHSPAADAAAGAVPAPASTDPSGD